MTLKMPKPYGYLCDWGNDSYGLTRQTFYYGEPGSGTVDDWNECPKVELNKPLYTADALRDVLEQAALYAEELGMITAPEIRALKDSIK